jgi:hypothetical protein
MPLIDKRDHHGAATVDELLHDLVEDTIHALTAGATTAFCPTDCTGHAASVAREAHTASVAAKPPPIREVAPLTDSPEPSGRSRAGGDEDPRQPH